MVPNLSKSEKKILCSRLSLITLTSNVTHFFHFIYLNGCGVILVKYLFNSARVLVSCKPITYIHDPNLHLTMCFRAAAGSLVFTAVRRARATASARALDRANPNPIINFLRYFSFGDSFSLLQSLYLSKRAPS